MLARYTATSRSSYRYSHRGRSMNGASSNVTVEQKEVPNIHVWRRSGFRRPGASARARHQTQAPAVPVVRAAVGDAAQGRAGGVAARARFHRRRRRPVHGADAQAGRSRPAERVGRVARHQALDPVRVPGDRAGVRPRRPVRGSHAPARTGADRHRSVPGDRDRAGVRARRRPALLELLHLLRHAVLRDDLHRRAARAASARERLAARPGGLRASRGAGRIRASTSTRSRGRWPTGRARGSTSSATSR